MSNKVSCTIYLKASLLEPFRSFYHVTDKGIFPVKENELKLTPKYSEEEINELK